MTTAAAAAAAHVAHAAAARAVGSSAEAAAAHAAGAAQKQQQPCTGRLASLLSSQARTYIALLTSAGPGSDRYGRADEHGAICEALVTGVACLCPSSHAS